MRQWRNILPNGAINEGIIWALPQPTTERPHGYKYRLNYSMPDGTFVRYDNKTGKTDHKHLMGKIEPYKFIDLDQLEEDFKTDILRIGGIL